MEENKEYRVEAETVRGPQLSIPTKSLLAKIWTKNSLLKFVF